MELNCLDLNKMNFAFESEQKLGIVIMNALVAFQERCAILDVVSYYPLSPLRYRANPLNEAPIGPEKDLMMKKNLMPF